MKIILNRGRENESKAAWHIQDEAGVPRFSVTFGILMIIITKENVFPLKQTCSDIG